MSTQFYPKTRFGGTYTTLKTLFYEQNKIHMYIPRNKIKSVGNYINLPEESNNLYGIHSTRAKKLSILSRRYNGTSWSIENRF